MLSKQEEERSEDQRVKQVESQDAEISKELQYLIDGQKGNASLFKEFDIPVAELSIPEHTRKILSKIGVTKVSEICSADFSVCSDDLTIGDVNRLFHSAYRKIHQIRKEKQLNTQEGKDIFDAKSKLNAEWMKLVNEGCINIYQRVIGLGNDYKKCFAEKSLFTDFSAFAARWNEINDNASEIRNRAFSIFHEWHLLDEKDLTNRLHCPTGLLINLWHYSIKEYAEKMSALMQHLHERSKGGEYTLEQYKEELSGTEEAERKYYMYHERLFKSLEKEEC